MTPISLLKCFLVMLVLTMTLNSIKAANNGTKDKCPDIDCSTSHKMWEISLEDYDECCSLSLCNCLFNWGPKWKCPTRWSKDMFDGFALFWYLQCPSFEAGACKQYFKRDSFAISTNIERMYLYVTHKKQSYEYLLRNPKKIRLREGFAELDLDNEVILPRLNTQGLWNIKMSLWAEKIPKDNELGSDPYYPSSFQIVNPEDPLEESRVVGQLGRLYGAETQTSFRHLRYSDQNKPEKLKLQVLPVLQDVNYEWKTNNKISQILFTTEYTLCMGRKINPKTKRTHWTGEGCRPKLVFADTREQKLVNHFNNDYEIRCSCDFESIGINAIDDPPDLHLVEGFNTMDGETTPTEDGRKVLIKEPSYATHYTYVYALILTIFCLVIIVFIIIFVVYFKYLAKN